MTSQIIKKKEQEKKEGPGQVGSALQALARGSYLSLGQQLGHLGLTSDPTVGLFSLAYFYFFFSKI